MFEDNEYKWTIIELESKVLLMVQVSQFYMTIYSAKLVLKGNCGPQANA